MVPASALSARDRLIPARPRAVVENPASSRVATLRARHTMTCAFAGSTLVSESGCRYFASRGSSVRVRSSPPPTTHPPHRLITTRRFSGRRTGAGPETGHTPFDRFCGFGALTTLCAGWGRAVRNRRTRVLRCLAPSRLMAPLAAPTSAFSEAGEAAWRSDSWFGNVTSLSRRLSSQRCCGLPNCLTPGNRPCEGLCLACARSCRRLGYQQRTC